MSYVIRNSHPSVIHLPDAGLRLESGQTAVVDTLSPQMEELLASRALEAISNDPDPPVTTVPVEEETSSTADVSTVPVSPVPDEETLLAPAIAESAVPVVPQKKTRKSGMATVPSERSDDTR